MIIIYYYIYITYYCTLLLSNEIFKNGGINGYFSIEVDDERSEDGWFLREKSIRKSADVIFFEEQNIGISANIFFFKDVTIPKKFNEEFLEAFSGKR